MNEVITDSGRCSSKVLEKLSTVRDYVWISILLGATLLLYSNTLTVPWYYDDFVNIIEQPYLRGLDQVLNLMFSFRGVAKLTFAMNYSLGGLSLAGFHLVNIFIHAGAVVTFYLVLKRVFRETPVFPFLCALLFAVHPVQTQAVTYIVQRMTSLSGLLFLLSLYCYIRFREKYDPNSDSIGITAILLWSAAILSGSLALYSKENAVVLPVVIYLFDLYFLGGNSDGWRRALLRTCPFALVPFLFAVYFFLAPLVKGAGIDALTKTATTIVSSQGLSPWTYFVTQWGVVWIYLRILLLPYGLTLDYSYPVVTSLMDLRNAVAGIGLAGLLFLAFKLRKSAPRSSFGITLFFLALAVESSFIPLDPMFVHRLYIPVAGFAIVVMDVLLRLPRRSVFLLLFCVITVAYALVAWQRNLLWRNPASFYEDNLRKAPHSERVRNLLAEQYMMAGRDEDAKRLLIEAIRINPSFGSSIVSLSNIYINEGNKSEAFELLDKGVRSNPNDHEIHNILGSLYGMVGRSGMAEYHLRQAIALKPNYGRAYCSLGVLYSSLGMWNEAESQYRFALTLSPNDPLTHFNLGVVLLSKEQKAEALQEFERTLKLDPKNRHVLYNLALVMNRLGEQKTARELHSRLGSISREMADKLAAEIKNSE